MHVLVTQLCPILCDTMDCNLPGSSGHGIFQARILEWIAISFSRGPSSPRDQTQVSKSQVEPLPSEPLESILKHTVLAWKQTRRPMEQRVQK